MTRRGDDFHRLVDRLERAYGMSPNVSVTSTDYLVDNDTGKPREFDVVVRYVEGRRTFIIAIECRDRTKKIDTPQVEAYAKKLEHSEANKGVIVSSRGFTEPALIKAAKNKIDCYTIEEIERPTWSLVSDMAVIEHKILHTHITARVISEIEEPWRIFRSEPDGDLEISGNDLSVFESGLFNSVLVNNPDIDFSRLAEGDVAGILVNITDVEEYYALAENGTRYAISSLSVAFDFTVSSHKKPMSFFRYSQGNDVEALYDGMKVDIDAPGLRGSLLMLNDNETTSIRFIHG